MLKIISYLPTIFTGRGPAYTAAAIAKEMARLDADIHFATPWAKVVMPSELAASAGVEGNLPYRAIKHSPLLPLAQSVIENKILKMIATSPSQVYLHVWPDARIPFLKKAKERGAILVREMINTHVQNARQILEAESVRIGMRPQHSIDSRHVLQEKAELELCDFIISPSDAVDESLTRFGLPPSKILKCTFGWDPERHHIRKRIYENGETLNALFVGSVGVRKGAHLAIDAWLSSKINGKLIFVGQVERDFRAILNKYISNEKIEYHRFTNEIQKFYRESDFMFFPTLEEGAPLISYEAAGYGLPILTSKMGLARMLVPDQSCLLLDPFDHHQMISTLARMSDSDTRARLGTAAQGIALQRTWSHAASERLALFRDLRPERFRA